MATKLTGKAASQARNETRKTKLKEAGVKTVVASGLKEKKVAGASSTSGLNAAQIGGASGIGFEPEENQTAISEVVKATIKAGGSKSQAGDKFGIAAKRAADLKAAKDRREQRDKLRKSGRLATDNLRASNLNTTTDEAITTQGPRSTPTTRDENQRTGAGTIDNPLTNIQIKDLEAQGIKEGDLVPGKGFLTPLGTFQSEYERKAEELTTAATNLSEKDKTPTDNITASDEPIVNEEKAAVDTINESAKVVRDLTYLDDEISRIQDELKAEIEAINAQAKVDKVNKVGEQTSEMGQTSVGLSNAGGYLGFSGSATGVLLNLAKTHRAELQSLDAERQQAIFEAQDAARESRFDIVKLKAQELKDIEQEEYNRKQDYLNQTKAINEKEAAKKEKAKTENDIYTAIQGGAKTTADIFAQLGGEVDAKTINDFLENITPEGSEGFKFSATQNASLLGSGMSMDDIRATSEYISANGYDETIRAALTPAQRAAVDKIFKTGAIGTGTGTNFTDQEQRKLEQAGLLTAPRQEQLDFLYGGDEGESPVKSIYTNQILEGDINLTSLPLEAQDEALAELLDLGFGSKVPPNWYKDFYESNSRLAFSTPNGAYKKTEVKTGPVTKEALTEAWHSYRKNKLGQTEDDDTSWIVNWN